MINFILTSEPGTGKIKKVVIHRNLYSCADVAQWQSSAFVMRRLAVRLRSSAPLPPDIPEDFLYAVSGGLFLERIMEK